MTALTILRVEGNLDRLIPLIEAQMTKSVEAGVVTVGKLHLERISKFARKPAFVGEKAPEEGKFYKSRRVVVSGPAAENWKRANYGTRPVTIDLRGTKRAMRFPYAGGRGRSYSAKSDGGTGARLGRPRTTQLITGRSIRARDFIKAVSEKRGIVFAAMRAGMKA